MRSVVTPICVRLVCSLPHGSFIFCRFAADLCGSFIQLAILACVANVLANLCGFSLPALPLRLWFMVLEKHWVMVQVTSFFHSIPFSVMVSSGSCSQGWFPLAGLPWILPCCALKHLSPLPTCKVPTSSQAHIMAMSSNCVRDMQLIFQCNFNPRHFLIE